MKESGRIFIYLFLFTFFITFLFNICMVDINPSQEGMQIKDRNIIIFGDSAFDNRPYVGTSESIPYLLQNHDIFKSVVLARDGAKISDLHQQIRTAEKDIGKSDRTAFISIGGNDILTLKDDQIDVDETIRDLFTTYTKILSNYTFKCKLVLCNIYIPYSKRGSFHERCIKKWNKQIYMFCKENNHNLMRFDKVLFEQNDFVDNLEPSRIGGRKIVDEMLNYVD